jgi:dihydrolipoamide dehydrogenase
MVPDKMPKSLLVVGSGAIGIEFASFFHTMGADVTVVEVLPQVLPVEDAEISKFAQKAFGKQGIKILLNTKVTKLEKKSDSVVATLDDGKGKTQTIEVDRVISAVGVVGNIENLGLEKLGVKTDRGCVVIDGYGKTNVTGIYAIGDVAGPPMLAHKGEREGVVLAELLAGKSTHGMDYGNIPNATYCHPEVASVGLTEQQCKDKKLDYKVGKFPFMASGRARTSGDTEGFVKVIRDAKYGEILGAHIVGAHATELIHELVVARANEFTVEEVDLAIHAHPTLSEAVAEACLESLGRMMQA